MSLGLEETRLSRDEGLHIGTCDETDDFEGGNGTKHGPRIGTRVRLHPTVTHYAPQPDVRGYVYLALMVLLGSTTAPFAQVAVSELPAGILPIFRFGVATL